MRARCTESDLTMILRIKSMVGKLGCHYLWSLGTQKLGSVVMSSKEKFAHVETCYFNVWHL